MTTGIRRAMIGLHRNWGSVESHVTTQMCYSLDRIARAAHSHTINEFHPVHQFINTLRLSFLIRVMATSATLSYI
jgi:hypothetical protein